MSILVFDMPIDGGEKAFANVQGPSCDSYSTRKPPPHELRLCMRAPACITIGFDAV